MKKVLLVILIIALGIPLLSFARDGGGKTGTYQLCSSGSTHVILNTETGIAKVFNGSSHWYTIEFQTGATGR
jgi:hypothetical protein